MPLFYYFLFISYLCIHLFHVFLIYLFDFIAHFTLFRHLVQQFKADLQLTEKTISKLEKELAQERTEKQQVYSSLTRKNEWMTINFLS